MDGEGDTCPLKQKLLYCAARFIDERHIYMAEYIAEQLRQLMLTLYLQAQPLKILIIFR